MAMHEPVYGPHNHASNINIEAVAEYRNNYHKYFRPFSAKNLLRTAFWVTVTIGFYKLTSYDGDIGAKRRYHHQVRYGVPGAHVKPNIDQNVNWGGVMLTDRVFAKLGNVPARPQEQQPQ